MKEQRSLMVAVVFAAALLFVGLGHAGDLEPSAPPAPTMKTLDDIYSTTSWSRKIPCDSAENCPRFVILSDFGNSAVLDKETGLVWENSAFGGMGLWSDGISLCASSFVGSRRGWRLPTIEQLLSLIDPAQHDPALPSGHPFFSVQSGETQFYWSASVDSTDTTRAYTFSFHNGLSGPVPKQKDTMGFVWCVRGGQTYNQ